MLNTFVSFIERNEDEVRYSNNCKELVTLFENDLKNLDKDNDSAVEKLSVKTAKMGAFLLITTENDERVVNIYKKYRDVNKFKYQR